jgi:phospholipid transport system substrate-binding protein
MKYTAQTIYAVVFSLGLLFSPLAFATGSGTDPAEQVKAATADIQRIAAEAKEQGPMVTQIEDVMKRLVDYQQFSASTMKSHWKDLDASQRTRFVDAFRSLITNTYAKRFQPGATFKTSYRGETAFIGDDRTKASVKTTVHGEKAAADVDYVFQASAPGGKGEWRVVDIVVDEVSMVRNWRSQFTKVMKRDGFEVLLTKIGKKAKSR